MDANKDALDKYIKRNIRVDQGNALFFKSPEIEDMMRRRSNYCWIQKEVGPLMEKVYKYQALRESEKEDLIKIYSCFKEEEKKRIAQISEEENKIAQIYEEYLLFGLVKTLPIENDDSGIDIEEKCLTKDSRCQSIGPRKKQIVINEHIYIPLIDILDLLKESVSTRSKTETELKDIAEKQLKYINFRKLMDCSIVEQDFHEIEQKTGDEQKIGDAKKSESFNWATFGDAEKFKSFNWATYFYENESLKRYDLETIESRYLLTLHNIIEYFPFFEIGKERYDLQECSKDGIQGNSYRYAVKSLAIIILTNASKLDQGIGKEVYQNRNDKMIKSFFDLTLSYFVFRLPYLYTGEPDMDFYYDAATVGSSANDEMDDEQESKGRGGEEELKSLKSFTKIQMEDGELPLTKTILLAELWIYMLYNISINRNQTIFYREHMLYSFLHMYEDSALNFVLPREGPEGGQSSGKNTRFRSLIRLRFIYLSIFVIVLKDEKLKEEASNSGMFEKMENNVRKILSIEGEDLKLKEPLTEMGDAFKDEYTWLSTERRKQKTGGWRLLVEPQKKNTFRQQLNNYINEIK